MIALKLKFTGPVHFGNERLDYGTANAFLHSDTLYSAICSTWAILGHEDWIDALNKNNDTAISSAFPYVEANNQVTFFLPKPYAPLFTYQEELPKGIDRKAPKKIMWVDSGDYDTWRNNGAIPMEASKMKGAYYTGAELPEYITVSSVQQRVMVSRKADEDAKPFMMERLYFHPNAGLYFLFNGKDEMLQRIKKALDILQSHGLGTDRNVGQGQFEYAEQKIELQKIAGDGGINLSLLCPENKQWLENNSKTPQNTGYSLIKRGGWITTPPFHTLRKNPITMFGEGSVFSFKGDVAGTVHNVLPDSLPEKMKPKHPVYRFGRSIFLPVKI